MTQVSRGFAALIAMSAFLLCANSASAADKFFDAAERDRCTSTTAANANPHWLCSTSAFSFVNVAGKPAESSEDFRTDPDARVWSTTMQRYSDFGPNMDAAGPWSRAPKYWHSVTWTPKVTLASNTAATDFHAAFCSAPSETDQCPASGQTGVVLLSQSAMDAPNSPTREFPTLAINRPEEAGTGSADPAEQPRFRIALRHTANESASHAHTTARLIATDVQWRVTDNEAPTVGVNVGESGAAAGYSSTSGAGAVEFNAEDASTGGGVKFQATEPTDNAALDTSGAAPPKLTIRRVGSTTDLTPDRSGINVTRATTLNDGQYTVQMSARDTFGITGTLNRTVSIDTSAPFLTFERPAPSTDGRPTFLVRAKDQELNGYASGVHGETPQLLIGSSETCCAVSANVERVADAGGVLFRITPRDELPDGKHTVTVRVRDGLENVATSTRTLTVDRARPNLSVSPANGSRIPATAKVSATATDPGGEDASGIANLRLVIDDRITVETPGSGGGGEAEGGGSSTATSAEFNPSDGETLCPGQHSATATAVDNAGHSVTTSWTFTVTGEPAETCPLPPGVDPPAPVELLSIDAAAAQRIVRQKGVVIRLECAKDCSAGAGGTIKVGKKKIALREKNVDLKAGEPGKLKLTVSKKDLKMIAKALKARKKLTAKVSVYANEVSESETPLESTLSKSIKLKK